MDLLLVLLLCFLLALLSLVGGIALWISPEKFSRAVLPLVALSAGALLGGAFFHLLPEAEETLGNNLWLVLALAFLLFFVLEQFLHWHHCHHSPKEHSPVGHMLLVANGIHSLLDGLAVAAAVLVDPALGLLAFALIAAHEIPQSLGDFGALVHSGWAPRRALIWNFVSSLPFVLGGALLFALPVDPAWILPIAAGGFLYIGASDLLPQLRAASPRQQAMEFLFLVLGFAILFALSLVPH